MMVGYDSMALNLEQFDVAPVNDLEIGLGSFRNGQQITGNTVLYKNANGAQRGSKAIYNAPNFNLTIKPSPQGVVYAIVTFSVPKVATSSNYTPADEPTLKEALKILQSDLTSIGIKTNVQNAALKRVDVTKNIVVDENIRSYLQLVKSLPCKFKDEWDYGSTLLLKNGQQQICIYDKLVEMAYKKINADGLPSTLRFEQRFKTRAKVNNYLGMKYVKDIVGNLDYVEQRYKDSMESNIFKLDTFDFKSTSTEKHRAEMEAMKPKHKSLLQHTLMRLGYESLENKEVFLEIFNEVANNKVAKCRAKKLFHELQMEVMSLEELPKGKVGDARLYQELKKKVLG